MENGTAKKTPASNRGVTCTTKKSLTSCIDWVSITFLLAKSWQEIAAILAIDSAYFDVSEKGLNGYRMSASFGRIQIFFEGHSENMGVWLNMSGQACRDFESTFKDSGYSWREFFKFVLGFDVNITRLDIAIDDFKGVFNLKQIESCIKKGSVVSLFKTARNFEEHLLSDGSTNGQTIYFGKSEVMVRFYDKYKERLNKGYSLNADVDFWVRTELQLRGERALVAVETIVEKEYEFGDFVCGVLNKYLCFKVANSTDINKRRWKTQRWWLKFLNGVSKISLGKEAPDKTILRSKDWVDSQVVPTIATLYEAFGDDNLFLDYILKTGRAKMSDKQKEMARDFKMDINKLIGLKEEMREAVGALNYDYEKDVYVDPVEVAAAEKINLELANLKRREKYHDEQIARLQVLEKKYAEKLGLNYDTGEITLI